MRLPAEAEALCRSEETERQPWLMVTGVAAQPGSAYP